MGIRLTPRRSWRAGNSAIEFALVAPVLLTMLMGVADYGTEVFYKAELQRAVRAGAQYATNTAHATDQAGITQTIQQASALTGIVVANLVDTCKCANGTAVACTGATCADGSSVGNYVTISGTYTYTPFISYFRAGPRTLSSTLSVRTS